MSHFAAQSLPTIGDGIDISTDHAQVTAALAYLHRHDAEDCKRQRSCNVALALAGKCKCPNCKLARDDRESPMNAGMALPGRHGVRVWSA